MTILTFQSADCVRAARSVSADHVARIALGNGMVLVVADGAGNSSAGKDAAAAVCAHVVDRVQAGGLPLCDEGAWVRLLTSCDEGVLRQGLGGETTAVALYVGDGRVVGASVGDSEAWLLVAGAAHVLTESQAHKPLLGTGRARPRGFTHSASVGTLLLASDGLFKYAPAEKVRAALECDDVTAGVIALAELPRLPSGALPDDVGVVVCHFGTS